MTDKSKEVGQIGIMEHPYMRDRHVIVRIAKVGKVICEVEQFGRGEFQATVRRKVTGWVPLADVSDLPKTDDQLRSAHNRLCQAEQQARQQYADRVRKIAGSRP